MSYSKTVPILKEYHYNLFMDYFIQREDGSDFAFLF